MHRLLALAALLALPLAVAQNASTDELPVGHEPPDEDESTEFEGPGMIYGAFVVLGTVAFATALAYAAWRYARRPPGGPPSPPQ